MILIVFGAEREIFVANRYSVPDAIVDLYAVLLEIRRAPSVDAVEVVRCGECKHNPGYKGKAKGTVWCRTWRNYTSTTGFCSRGERREAEDNPSVSHAADSSPYTGEPVRCMSGTVERLR